MRIIFSPASNDNGQGGEAETLGRRVEGMLASETEKLFKVDVCVFQSRLFPDSFFMALP